jgi:putative ABC transport system permease protein
MDQTRRLPPLAWKNLTESPVRLAASVAGTAFAVTLMFMEMGFRGALLDSMVAVVRDLDGEMFLVSRGLYTLSIPQSFSVRRLEQARSFGDVTSASPFYIETRRSRWRNPTDGLPRRIRVLAFPPERRTLLRLKALDDSLKGGLVEALKRPDTVVADHLSKPAMYGDFRTERSSELSGRRVAVVETFALGTDFGNDGTVVMSEQNFLSIFPERSGSPLGDAAKIDVGVLRVRLGADLERLRDELQNALPPDVLVLTKSDLVAKEQGFWDKVAPIGTVFSIGVVMGFIVGMAICYQVLYSDVSDRISEFATLKAMGYSNGWLFRRVVEQAVYLALLGYVAGVGVSLLAFREVHRATGLPLVFRPEMAALVLALTVLMCVLSACLAARRLVAADPAQLYQ